MVASSFSKPGAGRLSRVYRYEARSAQLEASAASSESRSGRASRRSVEVRIADQALAEGGRFEIFQA